MRWQRAKVQAQDEQIAALRAISARVLKRNAAGYSSYFEVIDAEITLFDSQLLRVQVYRNTLTSMVQLYEALGGGWQAADEAGPATRFK